jgi:hypothetical protein
MAKRIIERSRKPSKAASIMKISYISSWHLKMFNGISEGVSMAISVAHLNGRKAAGEKRI